MAFCAPLLFVRLLLTSDGVERFWLTHSCDFDIVLAQNNELATRSKALISDQSLMNVNELLLTNSSCTGLSSRPRLR